MMQVWGALLHNARKNQNLENRFRKIITISPAIERRFLKKLRATFFENLRVELPPSSEIALTKKAALKLVSLLRSPRVARPPWHATKKRFFLKKRQKNFSLFRIYTKKPLSGALHACSRSIEFHHSEFLKKVMTTSLEIFARFAKKEKTFQFKDKGKFSQ